MKLCFDSIDEVKEFVTQLKGTRGRKDAADDAPATGNAPAPMQPPAGGPASGFPGFPVAAAPTVAPEVAALVQRIITRVEAAVAAGATKPDDMLAWFRSQCGAEAASATWDQIKANFLPKMAVPQLDGMAKTMNA